MGKEWRILFVSHPSNADRLEETQGLTEWTGWISSLQSYSVKW